MPEIITPEVISTFLLLVFGYFTQRNIKGELKRYMKFKLDKVYTKLDAYKDRLDDLKSDHNGLSNKVDMLLYAGKRPPEE